MVGEPGGDGRGVVIETDSGAADPERRRAAQLPQNRDVSGFSNWQCGHLMGYPLSGRARAVPSSGPGTLMRGHHKTREGRCQFPFLFFGTPVL